MNPTASDLAATTFSCRTCGVYVAGFTDGSVTEPGWRDIDRIDGPNAICPECIADPEALDGLREEYPEVVMGAARVVRA